MAPIACYRGGAAHKSAVEAFCRRRGPDSSGCDRALPKRASFLLFGSFLQRLHSIP